MKNRFIVSIISIIITLMQVSNVTPSLSELPHINQILIACLRNLSGTTPPEVFSKFSGPVIQSISISSYPTSPPSTSLDDVKPLTAFVSVTGTPRVTIDDVALTLNAYNFLTILTKLNQVLTFRQDLNSLLFSFSTKCDTALDKFFDNLSKSYPRLSVILDIRSLKNLNMLVGAVDTRLISVAMVINLATVFNHDFMRFLEVENPNVHSKLSSLIPDLEHLIVSMAGLIDSIPNEEIPMKEREIKFPTYGQVVSIVNPNVNQVAAGRAVLHQLPMAPSAYIIPPSPYLEKAGSLFGLLNYFSEKF